MFVTISVLDFIFTMIFRIISVNNINVDLLSNSSVNYVKKYTFYYNYSTLKSKKLNRVNKTWKFLQFSSSSKKKKLEIILPLTFGEQFLRICHQMLQ